MEYNFFTYYTPILWFLSSMIVIYIFVINPFIEYVKAKKQNGGME